MAISEYSYPLPEKYWFKDLGFVNYPTKKERTGHNIGIVHPGLFFAKRFPKNPRMLDSLSSPVARELSGIMGQDMVLVELVNEWHTNMAIASTARALKEITDPKKTVFVKVLRGAEEYYQKLRGYLPGLIRDDNTQSVRVERTHGGKLGDITFEKDFDPAAIAGKSLMLIEDMGDQNLTLRRIVDQALGYEAASVGVAIEFNKLDVSGKLVLPEVQVVGFGMVDKWMGGEGADFQQELGRKMPGVWIQMPRDEYLVLVS